MRFENRTDAGRRLARRLEHLRGADVVVLGLAPGGVPVAYEVARHLGAPLDILVVDPPGVPSRPELDSGTISEDNTRHRNEDMLREVLRESGLSPAEQETAERSEPERRAHRCRPAGRGVPLADRTAVIVDDGLATGATAEAACRMVRARGAERVVLAVPVGPERTLPRLRGVADQVVCLQAPRCFGSAADWYHDFSETRDTEVVALLGGADRSAAAAGSPAGRDRPTEDCVVEVPAGPVRLAARLTLPTTARAVVAFGQVGDMSGRRRPRHQYMAAALRRAGLGTLLLDLLAEEEERNRHNLFDIVLLARRLEAAARWVRRETALAVSYFAAGTGAGAALEAAADDEILAVVSGGGRPDLASPAALARVRAPTLLIVGALDTRVLGRNRLAADWMHCEHRVHVIPGATHLFTEQGASDAVSCLALDWFTAHLVRPGAGAPSIGPV
ncbi:phosphoribosyltransferase family protein [Streptomyces sp. NPDC005760]|uniref:phosphoribosyltransferase family protein n=1 Tax=Streptomyces sp. NPDC005760 TaxID=3156718 RepID=UPI00340104A7